MREPTLSCPCPNNKSEHQPLCVDGMWNTVVIEPHYLYVHLFNTIHINRDTCCEAPSEHHLQAAE